MTQEINYQKMKVLFEKVTKSIKEIDELYQSYKADGDSHSYNHNIFYVIMLQFEKAKKIFENIQKDEEIDRHEFLEGLKNLATFQHMFFSMTWETCYEVTQMREILLNVFSDGLYYMTLLVGEMTKKQCVE